jgi:hypothetical protein
MDAILFSAKPTLVNVNDAIRHLSNHEKLYWEVGFRINPKNFHFPILGYIHICKGQVECVATISKIIPFSKDHYENKELSLRVKPSQWLKDWKENKNDIRNYSWKYELVMTNIKPFSYDTYKFRKHDGHYVTWAPRNYIRVMETL